MIKLQDSKDLKNSIYFKIEPCRPQQMPEMLNFIEKFVYDIVPNIPQLKVEGFGNCVVQVKFNIFIEKFFFELEISETLGTVIYFWQNYEALRS